MPYDDPDPTDPMTLHGVVWGMAAPPLEAMQEMAECFVGEYARLGFEPQRILRMFQTRGYAGPHMAYEKLGEAAIRTMIDEIVQRRGPRRAPEILENRTAGEFGLRVLG